MMIFPVFEIMINMIKHRIFPKKYVIEVGHIIYDISVSFLRKLKWSVERFSVSRVQHF